MANKAQQNDSSSDMGKMVAAGAGFAALAAGAYFFFGPEGKKHQKKMKGWMVRMKGEVLERMEEAQEFSQPIYNEIVDAVAKTQAVAGKVPKAEILALAEDLKRQWRTISRAAAPKAKIASPARKASSKPQAKKSVKKAAKK